VEELPRLKARISNLHELRDLIRAMRALAASHVQETQGTLAGIRGYVEVIEDAIAEGAALLPETGRRWLAVEPTTVSVLIVVCSEHGFTGVFNDSLLDRAESELRPEQQLGIIGRRGAMLAEERGLNVAWSFPMATHVGGILGVTRRVAERLADVSAAEIVFGSYRKGGHFAAEVKRVLPLDLALLAGSERRIRPLHQLDPDKLLQRLAGEYLFAEITHAAMESLASENGSRLQVMEAADHNIGDKLGVLRRQEHALRQDSITSELLDVVTATEAILEERGI
jgi:F-type H+-transporting ATPase subunit gamma